MFKKTVKEEIYADLYRFKPQKLSIWIMLKLVILEPCARFMFFYRLAATYDKTNVFGLFSRFWLHFLKPKFSIQIYLRAKIGKGFRLNHYGHILIGQGVTIGENCNVGQGVSIGNVSRGKYKGSPVIGDRVWIGPNTVVVGKINIGNDVLIAPLTYVNCDLPNGAVVSGNPCVIHNYNGSGVYVKHIYESEKLK
jgi:serine O-acetyltransferase